MRRLLSALAVPALAAAGLLVASAPPAAAAACQGTSGVTVVVQSDAGTSVRCAPGDPSSGLVALAAAGFSVEQVQRFPGAVCRIDGFPSTGGCVVMPPASAYWSYWKAQPGGSWSYSSSGAGSSNPAPGSVEGWRFGAGAPPTTAPPAAPAPPPPPPPPTTAPPAPPPATTAPQPAPAAPHPTQAPGTPGSGPATQPNQGSTSGGGTSASSTPTPDAPTGTAETSSAAAPSESASPTVGPSPDTASGATADAARETVGSGEREDAGNSPVGLYVGLALLVVLGAAALWAARRRSTT